MNREYDDSIKSEFDRAFILTEDETLSTTKQSITHEDSINSTIESEFRKKIEPKTKFFFNSEIVEKKIEPETKFFFNSKIVEKKIEPETKLFSNSRIIEKEVSNPKIKIIGDEILLDHYNLTAIKSKFPKTISSYSEIESQEEIVADSLKNVRESDIFPVLTAFNDTFNMSNDNIANDDVDIIQSVVEMYYLSPRRFSESLVTIIEESYLEKHEELVDSSKSLTDLSGSSKISRHKTPISYSRRMKPDKVLIDNPLSDGFKHFMKKSSAMQEILENETPPISITVTSADSRNSANNSSADETTKYYDLPNIKTLKRSPKIIVEPPSPVKILKKTPKARLWPITPKISKEKKSKVRFDQEEFEEIPNISKQSFLSPQYSDDDDDYLTAESETDESESSKVSTTNRIRESSTGGKSNISEIASRHEKWIKKFEEISQQQSFNAKSKQKKLSEYTNKLEKRRMKELNDERQKCFDLVNEIVEKRAALKKSGVSPPCRNLAGLTKEFWDVLQVFVDYLHYVKSLNQVSEIKKNSTPRYVSRASIKLRPRKSIDNSGPKSATNKLRKSLSKSSDSRTVTVSTKLAPSSIYSKPRRSLGLGATGKAKKPANKSPGLKVNDTRSRHLSPSPNNRGMQKRLNNSPVIDSSSLRPVSHLRKIFSPDTKTTDGLQPNKKETRRKAFIQSSLYPLRPEDVVSRVGQYIRGEKKY